MESVFNFSITGINGGSKFSTTLGGLHKSGGSAWSAVKVRGGVPKISGGNPNDLENLSNIVGSKATQILEKCIDDMCIGMLGELGNASNLSGKSLKDKVDLLLSKLPGPNETINEDMKTVLIAVAEQLNRSFQFSINTNEPVDKEVLMYDVVNTLSSLVIGLNTDVATAYNAIKGSATNLMDHAAILDKLLEYLETIVKNNSDKITDRNVIDGVIKTIKERSDSISTYAKNLMNGLEPKLNSAATGFKLNNLDKVQQLIARLNGKPYKETSDIEGYSAEIVKAFGEAVYYAYVINDALKKTNISINDLKRDGLTSADLTKKLKEIMDEYSKIVLRDPLHAGENEKMISEIMIQIRNGDNIKRIVSLIDNMKLDSVSGGKKSKNVTLPVQGAADIEYETPIGRRVRKQIRNKVAIMKAFNLVIGKAFDAIVKEIEFAKDLGYSTPITEDLIDFSENMDNLSDFRVPDVYMALIGFDKSSVGESTYNNYMRSIDNVLTSIKKLNSNSSYSSIHMKLTSVADHLEKFKSDVQEFRKGMSTVSNTFDGSIEKSGGKNTFSSELSDERFKNFDEDLPEILLYRSFGRLPFDDNTVKKINEIANNIEYKFAQNSNKYDLRKAKTNYENYQNILNTVSKKLQQTHSTLTPGQTHTPGHHPPGQTNTLGHHPPGHHPPGQTSQPGQTHPPGQTHTPGHHQHGQTNPSSTPGQFNLFGPSPTPGQFNLFGPSPTPGQTGQFNLLSQSSIQGQDMEMDLNYGDNFVDFVINLCEMIKNGDIFEFVDLFYNKGRLNMEGFLTEIKKLMNDENRKQDYYRLFSYINTFINNLVRDNEYKGVYDKKLIYLLSNLYHNVETKLEIENKLKEENSVYLINTNIVLISFLSIINYLYLKNAKQENNIKLFCDFIDNKTVILFNDPSDEYIMMCLSEIRRNEDGQSEQHLPPHERSYRARSKSPFQSLTQQRLSKLEELQQLRSYQAQSSSGQNLQQQLVEQPPSQSSTQQLSSQLGELQPSSQSSSGQNLQQQLVEQPPSQSSTQRLSSQLGEIQPSSQSQNTFGNELIGQLQKIYDILNVYPDNIYIHENILCLLSFMDNCKTNFNSPYSGPIFKSDTIANYDNISKLLYINFVSSIDQNIKISKSLMIIYLKSLVSTNIIHDDFLNYLDSCIKQMPNDIFLNIPDYISFIQYRDFNKKIILENIVVSEHRDLINLYNSVLLNSRFNMSSIKNTLGVFELVCEDKSRLEMWDKFESINYNNPIFRELKKYHSPEFLNEFILMIYLQCIMYCVNKNDDVDIIDVLSFINKNDYLKTDYKRRCLDILHDLTGYFHKSQIDQVGISGGTIYNIPRFGGVDNSYNLLKEALPENSKYTIKISEKLKSLKYYIRVAAIKENIKNVQGELEKDSNHYNNMTSEMIAEKIKQLNTLKENNINQLVNLYPNNDVQIKSMTKFYNDEYQVKRNLLEAAQALDGQLKLVTENIVKNPETIQEIKNMITDSDIISYWYDESSGNKLCELFEKFNQNNNVSIGTSEHYYKSIVFTGKVSLIQLMDDYTTKDYQLLDSDFYKNLYHNFMSLTKNYIVSDNIGTITNQLNTLRYITESLIQMSYNPAFRDTIIPINLNQLSNDDVLKKLTMGFGRRFVNTQIRNVALTDNFLLTPQNYGNLDHHFFFIKYEDYATFPYCNMFKYHIVPIVAKCMGLANINKNKSPIEIVKNFLAGFSVFLSHMMVFPDIHHYQNDLNTYFDSNKFLLFDDADANGFNNSIVDFLTLINGVRPQNINIPQSFTNAYVHVQNKIAANRIGLFSFDIIYIYLEDEMRSFLTTNVSTFESMIKLFYTKMINVMSRYMEYAIRHYRDHINTLGNISQNDYDYANQIIPKNNSPIINSIPIIAYEAIKNSDYWSGKNDNDTNGTYIQGCYLRGNNPMDFIFNCRFQADGEDYLRIIRQYYRDHISNDSLNNIISNNNTDPNLDSLRFFNKMKTTLGNFVDPLLLKDYPDLLKSVKSVFSSQAMLKNIIEIFLKIGGYKESSNSMHPKLLYSRLLDYCIRSSIDVLSANNLQGNNLAAANMRNVMGVQANQVNIANFPAVNVEGIILTTASRFSQYNSFNDSFEGEDEIFEMMMKSIVAKIFTILGVSDLFERPVGTTKPTALRLLIGGGETSNISLIANNSIRGGNEVPVVYDEIADLYVKLMLYLEFYKDIFRLDNIAANSIEISMIPDINNTFTKVIDIIFNRNNGNETGHYSVEDIKDFVKSVNDIYEKHKDPSKNPEQITKLIISNLVNEVNRRYGILTDTDASDYSNDKYLLYQMSDPSGDNKTKGYDSALLPDDELDESEIGFNAPSNKYLPDNLRDLNKTVYKLNEVRLDQDPDPNNPRRYLSNTWKRRVNALENFRNVLSRYFTNSGYNLDDDVDISDKVRTLSHIKRDLLNAKTPQDRFNVIALTMLGDDFTTTSNQIRYIMFHEMVVTNLTILKKIYSILAGFRMSLHKLKDLQNDINTFKNNLIALINNNYQNGLLDANDVYANVSPSPYLINNNFYQQYITLINANRYNGGVVYLPNISFLSQTRNTLNIDDLMQRMPNYSDNFVKLVNYCSLVSCEFQGLVKCNISNARINLSFGSLGQKIVDLFSDTKRYMDMFSGILPKKIIESFEDRKRPGSLYWINTHLIDDLLRGVNYNLNTPGNKSITLNKMSSIVSNISKILIGELVNNKRNNLGDALVKLTYFTPLRGGNPINQYLNELSPQSSILKNTTSSLNFSTNNRVNVLYSFNDSVNDPIVSFNGRSVSNKSLVCQFNDTLAKFLKVNTDSTNYKIYKPLINDLINSTFSDQIMGTKRLCDGIFDIQGYMLSEINKVKVTGSRDNGIDIFKSICQSIGVDGINFIPDLVHNELGNRWSGLALYIRAVPIQLNPVQFQGNLQPINFNTPLVSEAVGVNNSFLVGVNRIAYTPQTTISNNNFDNNRSVNGLYLNSISVQIDGIVNSYIFPVNGQLKFKDTLLNIWKNTINQIKTNTTFIKGRGGNATHNSDVTSENIYHGIPLDRSRLINMFMYADEITKQNYTGTFNNINAYRAGVNLTIGSIGGAVAANNGIAELIDLIFASLYGIFDVDPSLKNYRENNRIGIVGGDPFNSDRDTCLYSECDRAEQFNTSLGNAPKTWKNVFTAIEILSTLFCLSTPLAHFSYMVLGLFPDDAHSRFGFNIFKNFESNNVPKIGTKIICSVSNSIDPVGNIGPAFTGQNFHDSILNNISILIAIKLALLLKCKLPFDYEGYPKSLHEFIGNFINGDDVIRSFFTLRTSAPININLFDSYNESSMFMATVEQLTAHLETLAPSDPAAILSYTPTEYKRNIVSIKVQFRYELIKHIQVDELAPFIFGISENNYKSVKQDKLAKFARNAKSIGSSNNSNLVMELTLPSEGCGLFLSLSEILKQYVIERDFKDQTKYRFMADSISELTSSLQERMSISLPYFEKLFSQLVKRAELIKNIAQITGVQALVGLPLNIEEEIIIDGKNYLKIMPSMGMPYKDPLFNTGRDIDIKNNIISACDDVINGSVELIKSINSVIGELSFKPEFFEFKNGFVGSYQNINNKLPFMPLSQLTHSLKPVFVDVTIRKNNTNGNILLPPSDSDSHIYKYIHGCRYLMTKYNIPYSLDKMQSIRDLFSKLLSNSSLMITEESFKKSLDNTLSLLRFASDINNCGILSYSTLFEEISYLDLWVNQQSVNNIDTVNTYQSMDNISKYAAHLNFTYRILENDIGRQELTNLTNYLIINSNNVPAVPNVTPETNTEAVINVSNNNNQSTEFDNIKNVITNVTGQDHNRKWLIVQNILEVNIIPINIHMLQRDIPLIYLLNYSYTFDHMVQEFTRNYDNDKSLGQRALRNRSDQIYTKLLLNPYGTMDYNVYTNSYSALVRGQTSIGFGRLKFIGDQLFNKCLLNTLYYRNPVNEYDIPAQRSGNNGLYNRNTNSYTEIYYPDPNNPGQWASITVSRYIIYVGYQRFHSKIVRHLHFLTLLQHLILHKLGKELEDHDDIVIKSYPIVDPTITQFRGQEMWTDDTHKMSSYDRRPNRRVVPFSVINP